MQRGIKSRSLIDDRLRPCSALNPQFNAIGFGKQCLPCVLRCRLIIGKMCGPPCSSLIGGNDRLNHKGAGIGVARVTQNRRLGEARPQGCVPGHFSHPSPESNKADNRDFRADTGFT